MSVIKGNPQVDFKEQNPIVSTIAAFKEVYKNNKPDIASKKCWSMWLIEEADYNVNPYARIINRDERIKEIQNNYFNIDINTEEYKSLVYDFSKFILTTEESLYRIHVRKFEEMSTFLDNLSLENDKEFDKYYKIMDKLDKMWKGLQMVKETMVEAQNKSKVRGNAQLSAREKRKR